MQRTPRRLIAITMLAALTTLVQLAAQDKLKHHQYKLYDVGTFGGHYSVTSTFATSLTRAGSIGLAETPSPDPYDPNCFYACLVSHAFLWRNGVTRDLGALPGSNGGNSSYGFAISDSGEVVGISENGQIDPATGNPEAVGVVWKNRTLINLGTFGGAQSIAADNNNRGQIVGWAMNTIADPYSADLEFLGVAGSFPGTTQLRAALWDRTGMHDLGTLGGPSALAFVVNDSGQIAGYSYTNFDPNPTTGIPTIDPFIWNRGHMTDLGSLGGTIGFANWMNDRGQVVGQSNLAGDQNYHGFLWERGVLRDLSLGGSHAAANWISDGGVGVGFSNLPGDQVYHSFLWNHRRMTDLGTLPGDQCSIAYSVNNQQQVVGYSFNLCDDYSTRTAFLSENGRRMVDLNALIEPPSDLHVYAAFFVSEHGVIVGQGRLANGDAHTVILVPEGDCGSGCEQRIAASEHSNAIAQPASAGKGPFMLGQPEDRPQNRFGQSLSLPRPGVGPSN